MLKAYSSQLKAQNIMTKICCFGELLLRFSPKAEGAWIQNAAMPVFVGGAELNVATALANWGLNASYFTALPDNSLATDIKNYIQSKGINTDSINTSGERIGTYYLPQGSDLKNAGVIYDRAYSSFASLKVGQIDWKSVLKDVSWFHFSAISPALNQDAADVCLEVLQVASEMNITISVDLNYRAKLWKYGKKPVEIMPTLAQYCDVIMGNIWAANTLLGIEIDPLLLASTAKVPDYDYLQHGKATSEAIQKTFPKCKFVANTYRFDYQTTGIEYYTSLFTEGEQFVSPLFYAESVADKIGSGDCFMGGLIYGLSQAHHPQTVINYASAAAYGKLQEYGDATQQSVSQVEAILEKVSK